MKEVEEAINLLKPSEPTFEMKKSPWSNGYEISKVHSITPTPYDIQMKGMYMQDYLITRLVMEEAQEHFDADTMTFKLDKESIRRNVFHAFLRHVHTVIENKSIAKNANRTKMVRFLNTVHYDANNPVVELIFGIYKAIVQTVPQDQEAAHMANILAAMEFIREKYDKNDYTKKRNKRRGR